jgi:hypothetical protein
VTAFCEQGNQCPSGSIQGGRFLDHLCDSRFLKASAPWNYLFSLYIFLNFDSFLIFGKMKRVLLLLRQL